MGLGSNSNDFITCNCNDFSIGSMTPPGPLVIVTLQPSQDIVADNGFGMQLNAYSAKGYTVAIQQYVVWFQPGYTGDTSLYCQIANWINPSAVEINSLDTLATLPKAGAFPGNYAIGIILYGDANNNVSEVNFSCFTATSRLGEKQITLTTLFTDQGKLVTEADLAPIVAFQVNLVGDGNATSTTLSSGGGHIRYAGGPLPGLYVANATPSCVALDYRTAETSNTTYSQLIGGGPYGSIEQGWSFSGAPVNAARPGAVMRKLIHVS